MNHANSSNYAIVTGGGSGIGRAFCVALARRGWQVAVVDLDRDAAAATVAQVEAAGGTSEVHPFDVADCEAWSTLREKLCETWPRLDLLINSAGVLAAGDISALDTEIERRVIEVNLLGTLWGCRTMTPWLRTSAEFVDARPVPPGIINVASIFAALAPPGFAAYNASKAGVVALSETLRGELRPHGLNVTVVLPGVVPTALFKSAHYADERYATLARRYVEDSRLGPEWVAAAALSAHQRGKLYAVVGRRARIFWRWKHLFPGQLIDLIARRTARELESTNQLASRRT